MQKKELMRHTLEMTKEDIEAVKQMMDGDRCSRSKRTKQSDGMAEWRSMKDAQRVTFGEHNVRS